MGVNKLFEYLKARKLVKVYQVNNEKCDALFIDGTNIFCMFSNIHQMEKVHILKSKD